MYKYNLQDGRWQKKRLEILSRDKFECLNCHESNNLQVHHLHYEANLKPWEYDNDSLVTLCDLCHDIIHKDLAKISGIIAFKALIGKVDLTSLVP
jgi:5-methylcytosine-specific restriction endonuclease McrA